VNLQNAGQVFCAKQGWLLFFPLALPAWAHAQAASDWATHNRYLEIGAGVRQQNYRELESFSVTPLTPDGILDKETGTQDAISAALRWQSHGGFFVDLTVDQQSGATDYRGYLQHSDGTLSPYLARSGNLSRQASLQFGYAFNAGNGQAMPDNWQLIPVVQISQSDWQRNLVQYSETYSHTTYAVGAIAQWQARPGTLLEAQALAGRTKSAQVSVPALGFDARQDGGNLRELRLSISQDLGSATQREQLRGWRLYVRYVTSQYNHGASPTVVGFQAPANEVTPSTVTLGVQKQF